MELDIKILPTINTECKLNLQITEMKEKNIQDLKKITTEMKEKDSM
jgi:hypothetical protein